MCIRDRMNMAAEPMGDSEKVFVLPENIIMPETIKWDESREKFLVGTIADGRIVSVGMDGQAEELIKADNENGLWAVLDLLVDPANNRLWVTSAALPGFSGFDVTDKG